MTPPRPASYAYLFGPVLSRRMGWSLGIDLVPHKTCSFDCPFCQVGRTTRKTAVRREYVPVRAVLSELRDWMSRGGKADHITLAGSGEPTLHSHFGEVLMAARDEGRYRTALLSNGALFFRPGVRRDACHADIVKASLSAWDEDSFRHVNRPHPALSFRHVIRGLAEFRNVFCGEFWIEVFLLRGLNDAVSQVQRIAARVASIGPNQVQLNTVVRPPAERSALAVTAGRLGELADLFTPRATVIATACGQSGLQSTDSPRGSVPEESIVALVRRHPAGAADIAKGLGLVVADVELVLEGLWRRKKVKRERREGMVYYHAATFNRGGD